MEKYKCTVCNYIYDPERGEDKIGVPAGTAFEELPEERTCPMCRSGKAKFCLTKPREFSMPKK